MRTYSVLVASLCILSSCLAENALPRSSRAFARTSTSVAQNPRIPTLKKAACTRGGSVGGVLASYDSFSKTRPFENGVIISLIKTALADMLAQSALPGPHDWGRTAMFGVFGAFYLGMFQYFYQVLVFKRLFKSTERFTSAPLAAKLKDYNGLISLFFQICLDMCVLSGIYLPTFYIFKSVAFAPDCSGPVGCVTAGYNHYLEGFAKDLPALLACWVPADVVCFSIPLHLRLPIRHVWSFMWHVYLSYFRGASH